MAETYFRSILNRFGLGQSTPAPAPTPSPSAKSHTQRGLFVGAYPAHEASRRRMTIESANQELLRDLSKLRGRSRDLMKNNPYARQYKRLISVNVFGEHGILLQPRVRNATDEMNQPVNALLKKHWDAWGECASADQRMSWQQIEQLVSDSLVEDGEAFVLMHMGKGSGIKNAYDFALQVIDADYLDHTYSVPRLFKSGNKVEQGIEVDRFNAPVAYHFWSNHPSEGGGKRLRIPADMVLHVYLPQRVAQARGIPWLSPVMNSLDLLNAYLDAELKGAYVGATQMGVVIPGEDNAAAIEAALANGGAAVRPEYWDASPGTIQVLHAGDQFEQFTPAHPTTAFDGFTKTVLRGISAGLGVSYASLTYDFSQESFSASKMARKNEVNWYKTVQQTAIRQLHRKVYALWLKTVMEAGHIGIPAALYDDCLTVDWRAPGFDAVDELKDINAFKAELEAGVNSRTRYAAEKGRDIREVFADLDRENQLMAEYGLKSAPASAVNASEVAAESPTQPDVTATSSDASVPPAPEDVSSADLPTGDVNE